jgi:hypothetical protein
MSNQPQEQSSVEALRLADALGLIYAHLTAVPEINQQAAAELRCLHKEVREWDRVCDQHLKHIDKLKKRMKQAEALNQELLEFARAVVRYAGSSCDDYLADQARAAIAKAEGQA